MMDDHVADLWKKPKFTARLLNLILDEGQCVSQWNRFRKDYLHIGNLCYLIPSKFSFYIPSATLPPYVVEDISNILPLHPKKKEVIRQSNNRPNVFFSVCTIKFAANTYKDLSFLLPHPHSPLAASCCKIFLSSLTTFNSVRQLLNICKVCYQGCYEGRSSISR